MSHTIVRQNQIPAAHCYVLTNDRFMSGWGEARDKTNTIILPCESLEQAEIVVRNCSDRSEQQNIRIVWNKPRLRTNVVYSLLTAQGSPYWFDTSRPFRHEEVKP